jgi:hypothetical protein
MAPSEADSFWRGAPRRPLDVSETSGTFGEPILRTGSRWNWLEELRLRFDLGVEVLDADLDYVFAPLPDDHPAVAVRAALQGSPQILRDTATLIARSTRPRSSVTGGITVAMFPLYARGTGEPVIAGFLVIGDVRKTGEADRGWSKEIDRRLDEAGRWLVAAIEVALQTSTTEAPELKASQRLVGVIDVLDELSRREDPEDIIDLLMDAIALWYDADVRVYHQTMSGTFALHRCLPGARPPEPAPELPGHQIWGREDVFAFDALQDVETFDWDLPIAHTLFIPILVEDSTEWLLTVSGPPDDLSMRTTLGVVARVVGAVVGDRQRRASDRLERKLSAIFAFGDAPFDAIARIGLEAVGQETGADSARVAIYYETDRPVVSFAWGRAVSDVVPFVDAAATSVTPDAIAIGAAAGSGAVAVLALKWSPASARTPSALRVARSAGAIFGIWLSGALIRHRETAARAEGAYSSIFLGRLSEELDRLRRLKIGGAVAVVLAPEGAPTGVELDDLVQAVQDQVRASDVVGVIESTGAGVLLAEATRDVASAIVGRVMQAARALGLPANKAGVATFSEFPEPPEALLNRALMSARSGSSRS